MRIPAGKSYALNDQTKNPYHLVVFALDEQRYGLYPGSVERIVNMVEVTPFPDATEIVPGVVNVQGRIIPVVNLRRLFHLPCREIDLNDRLIIAHTSTQHAALLADTVSGVVACSENEVILSHGIVPDPEYVKGAVKFEDDMIIILDIDAILSFKWKKSNQQKEGK